MTQKQIIITSTRDDNDQSEIPDTVVEREKFKLSNEKYNTAHVNGRENLNKYANTITVLNLYQYDDRTMHSMWNLDKNQSKATKQIRQKALFMEKQEM